MRGLDYKFSAGWNKTVQGNRGAIDIRNSEWDINKLKFDEQKNYLRILGICFAKVSYPHHNVVRVNVTNEKVLSYIEKEIPETERYAKNKNRITPEVSLTDPAFAYSYYKKPKIGKELSRYLLEGVLTAAAGDAIWMRDKPSEPCVDHDLGIEKRHERHDKVQIHSRNADIIYNIQFYVTHRDWHKMAWVPYNRGPSIGLWWPIPAESGVRDFIFDSQLRTEAEKFYSFPGIDNPLINEICTLAQRHVYEWAAGEGLLTVSQYQEAQTISKALHDEAKVLRHEWERVNEERGSLEEKYMQELAGLKPIEDLDRIKRIQVQKEHIRKEYSCKADALEAKISRLEAREAEFLEKAHNLRPHRRKRQTDGHDYSYGSRQWQQIKERELV